MTSKKTSQENSASLPLTGTELVRIVQSGANAKTTVQDIADLGGGGGGGGGGDRTQLTADTSYYVRADGSDSNNGLANTSGGAWLTLQHAMHEIAKTIDFSSFKLTLNVGAGSFAGLDYESTVGGGILQILGAGVDTTFITNGPNDGISHYGECLGVSVPADCILAIDGLTLQPSTTSAINANVAGLHLFLGQFPAFTCDLKIDATGFTNAVIGIAPQVLVQTGGGPLQVKCNGGGATVGLIYCAGIFQAEGLALTLLDTFTSTRGFVCTDDRAWGDTGGRIDFAFGSTITGTAVGPRFSLGGGGCITTTGHSNDLEFFPGSTPGEAYSGFYDDLVFGVNITQLTADTTYHVAATGNDTTGDGSSGSPWATVIHAMAWLNANINAAGFDVRLSIGNGTYAGPYIFNIPVNCAFFIIEGNLADPTQVVFDDSNVGWNCCWVTAAGTISFDGITFKATSPNGYAGLVVGGIGSLVYVAGTKFMTDGVLAGGEALPVYYGQVVLGQSIVYGTHGGVQGNKTITIENDWYWAAVSIYQTCTGYFVPTTIFALVGTPDFANAVFYVQNGDLDVSSIASVTGSATGPKYYVEADGTFKSGGVALPGSLPGVVTSGVVNEQPTTSQTMFAKCFSLTAIPFASAPSAVEGNICAFTDSTTNTWGAVIAGSGANHVLGYYNGTNWTVIGK